MKKNKNPYVILVGIISILYAVLFAKFIVGDSAYFFTGMGDDTLNINYPLYHFFSDMFQSKNFDTYFLNVGLGMDMTSNMFPYLNPLNFVILLLSERLIVWGVIFLVYVKLLLIGIFGYKFFQKHIRNEWGSLAAALAWTFSSYIMLWGQHYGFLTAIVMFTIFMYLVHLFVDENEKSRNGILALWVTWMLFTSYYFLYTTAVISALYVLVYCICKKKSCKELILKMVALGAMGVLGVCIGGVCLTATLNDFTNSARTEVLGIGGLDFLFRPYDMEWVSCQFARIVSNNIIGVAEDYSGVINYYEVAMLFTSSLFFFALPVLVQKRRYRKMTLSMVVLAIASIIFPVSGKLFNLTVTSYRWTFVICFMEALAIGMAVKEILHTQNKKELYWSVGSGVILSVLVSAGIVMGEYKEYYEVSYKYLAVFLAFVMLYGACILISAFSEKIKKKMPVLLVGVLTVEMVICNYPTINHRNFPTRHQLATDYYHDGTEGVYDELQEEDDSLYRVSKNYTSASENDSVIQGYAGTSVYMITNPKELIQLKNMYGADAIGSNRISFKEENYVWQTLLGEKYLFTLDQAIVSEDNYSYVKTVGDKHVYVNDNAVPFGYLYDEAWDKSQVEQMSELNRSLAAVDGFYYTDGSEATIYETAELGETVGYSLLNHEIAQNECTTTITSDGITISEMGGDPFIVFRDISSYFDDSAIHKIRIEVETEQAIDMAIYYKMSDEEDFRGDKIYIFSVSPEQSTWEYIVPGDIDDIRVDISDEISEVTIKSLEIINCTEASESLEELKNSKVTNTSFEDDTYRATVNNESDSVQMLCVPLLYSDKWSVTVDGEKSEVYNINSGLCGIEIASGEHDVVMEYQASYLKTGLVISGIGILIYGLWMVVENRKKKMRK